MSLSLKSMNINSLQQINFQGRSGLSRSLSARFTESRFLYTFMALATCLGFFTIMSGGFFTTLFFSVTAYIAWVLKKTSGLRVHLHGKRLIYELKNNDGIIFTLDEIQNIRIGHSWGIYGLFVVLKSGVSCHFPIHLERLDYILDSLHVLRSDLTLTEGFLKFRKNALIVDHILAHNTSYLTRAHVKAFSFYFIYPFYVRHSLKRLKADPNLVKRDMDYERKMETLCHRVNIGLSLTTLAAVALWTFHI